MHVTRAHTCARYACKRRELPAAAAAAVAVREHVTRESPTKKPRVLHDSAKRVAIASQYVYAHRQCDSKEWFGADGTIVKILGEITWLPEGSWGTVLAVLTEVQLCARQHQCNKA